MRILSLGWGVQSFTLAAMSALDELPPINAAIHADTTHERGETYTFARAWTSWLEERKIKVITVKTDKIELGEKAVVDIPAFTISKMGGKGQIRRQCTTGWKIVPIRRWLQANRNHQPVELWLGISTDEALRIKPSDVKYITHRWPLIERKMSRNDCVAWLRNHELEVPTKSSCVFCPYHNTATWRELKASSNGDWKRATEVDEAIRKARPPFDLFVHPARKPLIEVDLRTMEEMGQMSLWDEECSGLCGV